MNVQIISMRSAAIIYWIMPNKKVNTEIMAQLKQMKLITMLANREKKKT